MTQLLGGSCLCCGARSSTPCYGFKARRGEAISTAGCGNIRVRIGQRHRSVSQLITEKCMQRCRAAFSRSLVSISSRPHNASTRGRGTGVKSGSAQQLCKQPHTLNLIGTSHIRKACIARKTVIAQMNGQTQQLQSLHASKDAICTDTGAQVLSGCFTSAYVKHADTDGIFLGCKSPSGPAALQDLQLGKVTHQITTTHKRYFPAETQFLLMQTREDGPYILLLPLISNGAFRATLRPSPLGVSDPHSLYLRIESGDASVQAESWDQVLYIAAGKDPFALLDAAIAKAAAMSGGAKPLHQKKLPASLDMFGWCTWDAYYFRVSAKGIMQGLQSFKQGGVQPRFLVIDDGWQLTEVDDPYQQTASLARQAQAKQLAQSAGAEAASGGDPDAISHASDSTHAQQRPGSHTQQANTTASHPNSSRASRDASPRNPIWAVLVSVWLFINRLLGGFIGKVMYALNDRLASTDPPAWALKGISALASGPMKHTILKMYSEAGDHSRRLSSVKANAKFSSVQAGPDEPWQSKPEDLKAVVKTIKEEFGISLVYCWHALHAYWNGVAASAAGTKLYSSQITFPVPTAGVQELEPSMLWSAAVVAGMGAVADPKQLHHDMHSYLANCGVDGVKVDVQASVALMGSQLGGGPHMTAQYHQSLEQSVKTSFPGNHCINCMCHSTENIYRMENTAVARVSDDFYPTNAASWKCHLGICAYNSLFMGALVQADWDMFHSQHPAALLHATARAVSGGAVYVSDKPGQQDYALLKRLVLPGGSVLRAKLPARPTKDILFKDVLKDNKTLLKVWNMNPVNGVVGVFNIQGSSWSRKKRQFHIHNPDPPTLQTLVRPSDVHPFAQDGTSANDCAVYSDKTGSLVLATQDKDVCVKVASGECDVVTVAPVHSVAMGFQIACIGLVNMLNAGGAVLDVKLGSTRNGSAQCEVLVKGFGQLLFYATAAPNQVTSNSKSLKFEYEGKRLMIDMPNAPGLQNVVLVQF